MRLFVCALALSVSVGAFAQDTEDAERRIIRYITENAKPGERLVVSQLYNEVFTTPEERAALDKLTNAFFRIPLFIMEFEGREDRMPTLEEISGQFAFYGPEEAAVVLSVMEADPRMPKNFVQRDPQTGELTGINKEAVKADARFNQAVERTLTGWEGKRIPALSGTSFAGDETSFGQYSGKVVLVYVWFTNCPPCVKIAPELIALQNKYESKGFAVLGLNADTILKLKYDDAYRAEYAEKIGTNYTNLHLTDEVRASLGNVNIFPTLFLVNGSGTIVKHFVNFQSQEVLAPEIEKALGPAAVSEDQ